MARTVPFSQARSQLTALVDDVERLHEHVVLTRNGRPSVVVMSMAEYEALQETAYLLRSPANARRLIGAVEALTKGKGVRRKIQLGA